MVAIIQLRLALETEEIGFDYLIWIEIGNSKNSRNELIRPVMGTIFLG